MFKDTKAFSSFSVDNIDKAREFYEDVLGLRVDQTPQGLALHIANGGEVFIYAKPNHVPATFTVLNFPVENVEEYVDKLSAAGVQFEHYDEEQMKTDEKGIAYGGGQTIAWFKDPAGNFLSVLKENN